MNLRPIKANMTEIEIDGLVFLFSYKTCVAIKDHKDGVKYVTNKFWSKTTSRHISQWLKAFGADENYKNKKENMAFKFKPQEWFDNFQMEVK